MSQTAQNRGTPSTRDLFGLAWPLGLKAIMLHGIIVVDAYLVAPLGEAALAAMGLAGALAGLLLGILFSFSNATQIRIAQAFGAAGPVALKTSFFCGLLINLAATALGLVVVIFFGDQIIDYFAHTPEIADQAIGYLHVFLWLVVFEAVGQCLSSHFNGCGNTKLSFYSYLIAMPINIGLSIVLIYGLYGFPELGVVGAAYGSAAAAAARVAFLGWRFWRSEGDIIAAKGWSKDTFRHALKRHWLFSLPIAATFISMSIGTQVSMLVYATMTVNEFAAMTLIMPWVQTAGVFGMAWAQAVGIAVAQLLGKDLDEASLDEFLSRAWRASFVASVFVALAYLVIILMSDRLYDDLQQQTRAYLMTFLPVLLLLPFPKGSNAICGQTLRAAGDTVRVMNIFLLGQWVFKVPLTILFVIYLDLHIAWVFALVLIEELVKFPPFHLRLFTGNWKRAQVFDD
ncbi:putative efflux protein, MATE family [Octadecabacter temperatus]|uniref:Multidrug resistance protein MdtK n=1 Tax=Octadecabacter temperatus TaxID=1458307 RepID=A0A0K0Y6Q8_9RHOB|nr:MATE family efflux transporter [Octadecabacter temperatus]AKS46653.1 Multidrug resistance protein MdtK [Octadecabacter temperatus]SIO18633.1 putative efflux protein, MATE family [Octadecabacter temperatus]